MLSFFRRHVSTRLALIWLAVAVPLTGVLLFTYFVWYSARLDLTQQERAGYARTVAGELDSLLGDIRYDLRDSGGPVRDAGPPSWRAQAELRRLTEEYPAAYTAFVDESGRVLGSSDPGIAGSNLSDDEAFRTAMQDPGGFGIEPSKEASGGLVGFHVAQRIPPGVVRTAGVMMMFIDVRRLHNEFPVEVPNGGISVIDSAGQVVFQNESARFAETRARWDDIFPFVRRALDGDVATTRDFRFPTGGTRIGVFVPIEPIGWAAGSSVAPSVALAPFYRALALGGSLALLIGIAALIVSIGTAGGIRRSLDDLSEDADRIGADRLDEPVRTEREDEIGDVARSLEAARTSLLEARQRAEQELDVTQTILRAADALATPVEFEDVLKTVARLFAEVSGRSRIAVDLLDPEGDSLVVAHVLGEPRIPDGTRLPIELVPSQMLEQLEEGRPVVIDFDTLPLTKESATFFERLGVKYILGVPLISAGRMLGLVSADDPGLRRQFDRRILHVAEGVGPQAASAIDRARAANALRDSERRFRVLVTATDDAVYRMSPDWSVLRRLEGQKFLASTERDSPDWLRKYIPESDQAMVAAAIEEAMRSRGVFELEHRVYLADGSVGWARSRAVPLFDEHGSITEWFGVASDITERRRAGEALRREAQLSEALNEIDARITSTLRAGEIMSSVVESVGRTMEADSAAIFVAADDGFEARYGWQAPDWLRGRRVTADEIPFSATALAERSVLLFDEPSEHPLWEGSVAQRLGAAQVLDAPLLIGEEAYGDLILYRLHGEERWTETEVDFVRKVATSLSLALGNARLYEAERERARLGRSMAQISSDLASSLNVGETLPRVLAEVRRELGAAGATIVDRVDAAWRVREVAGTRAPGVEAGAVITDEQAPRLTQLLRTREPQAVADVRIVSGTNAEVAERAGIRAYVEYPLVVRGDTTGALTAFFAEPRSLSEEELDYMRRVAFAISLAEENGRLYEAEHQIAQTLQSALLALPERIPGIEFAHLYRSATEAARVGGDFYDLFELEHNLVGIIVGDISGHGVEAAALTSLLKNAIRVQASQQDKKPNEVIAATSELMLANSPMELFATVFFGVLNLESGLLEYCNAGHTTGACLCCGTRVTKLQSTAPLIGAIEGLTFDLATAEMDVGDLLFLYTDGLTEARRDHDLFGEDRLFDLLEGEPRDDPEETLRHVVEATLEFANGRLSDDLAILAVERTGVGSAAAQATETG